MKKINDGNCTLKEKNLYLTGVFGQNILNGIVTAGLTFYYQSVIFLPAMFISVLTIAVRIFDIVKDPFIGASMDRKSGGKGKFRPYLLTGPFILVVSTFFLFMNGIYGETNSEGVNVLILIWSAVSYLAWSVIFTYSDIPANGLPSVMTGNGKERSTIITGARIMAVIGSGIVFLIMTPAANFFAEIYKTYTVDPNKALQYGYLTIVLVLTLIGGVLFQLIAIRAKERVICVHSEKVGFKKTFAIMWKSKPYRRLLIAGLFRAPSGIFNIVQLTMFVYYFGNGGSKSYIVYMIILMFSEFVGQGAAMLITPKLANRFNNKKLMNFSAAISAVPCLLLLALYFIFPNSLDTPLPFALLSILSMLICAFGGIINVLFPVMVSDSVEYASAETGKRNEGIFFSGFTMMNKLCYGIAAFIVGIVFAAVGFSGSGVQAVNEALYNGAVFKSDDAFGIFRFAIFFLMSIPPAAAQLLSIIPMRKYEIKNNYSAGTVENAEAGDNSEK